MTSWLYFNMQVSVPPTLDTTPCMEHMLDYEDCVLDAKTARPEFYTPSWPTIFPLLMLYRKDAPSPMGPEYSKEAKDSNVVSSFEHWPIGFHPKLFFKTRQLTDQNFQMLYECEEERMVYKSCLRKLISLKRSIKHTSWDTAEVSALYLT